MTISSGQRKLSIINGCPYKAGVLRLYIAGFHCKECNNLFIIVKILSFLSMKVLCIDPEGDSCFSIYPIKLKKRKSNFWK